MSEHRDELGPEEAAFIDQLRADFQPPPLGPGGAQAFDARLSARRAQRARRARWAWGVGLPVALAGAAALVVSLRASPPAVDAPQPLPAPAVAVATEPPAEEAPVLALLTDAELDDDELYPDDYAALADALAWD